MVETGRRGEMVPAESDADNRQPGGGQGAVPGSQAMLREVLSLRSKAIRVIGRQVSELKGVSAGPQERELLEHIDLCISIASRLSHYANACIADPAAAGDPDVRRFVIDASLLLSQHEDDAPEG